MGIGLRIMALSLQTTRDSGNFYAVFINDYYITSTGSEPNFTCIYICVCIYSCIHMHSLCRYISLSSRALEVCDLSHHGMVALPMPEKVFK